MLTNNDILRISGLLDKKLRPFSEELHQVESRLDAKITKVEAGLNSKIEQVETVLNSKIEQVEASLDTKITQVESRLDSKITKVETSLEAKIEQNGNDIHKINLTLENTIVPRLQDIESCYTDTYDRYRIAAEESYGMKADIEILKNVAQEHSLKLQGGVVL